MIRIDDLVRELELKVLVPTTKTELDIVHGTVRQHIIRANADFLRRLKQQTDIAFQFVTYLHQDAGCAQQDGSMHVMAAGMHASRYFRSERKPGLFFQIQSVHIRS